MNILFCCLFATLNATVGELPPCDYADTEVSTNFPVTVDFSEMSRIEFTLAFAASPSNAVEVAIGTDADGDGDLSVEEAAYTFGCDCGTWFCRNAVDDRLQVLGTVLETALASADRVSRRFVLKKTRLDTDWNLAKVTRRGSAAILECADANGAFPRSLFILK